MNPGKGFNLDDLVGLRDEETLTHKERLNRMDAVKELMSDIGSRGYVIFDSSTGSAEKLDVYLLGDVTTSHDLSYINIRGRRVSIYSCHEPGGSCYFFHGECSYEFPFTHVGQSVNILNTKESEVKMKIHSAKVRERMAEGEYKDSIVGVIEDIVERMKRPYKDQGI